MLKKRLLTSACAIPVLVALIWFDEPLPWFTLAIAVWGILASLEFYRLVSNLKVSPMTYFGLVWSLLFILSGDTSLIDILGPGFNSGMLAPLLLASATLVPLSWRLFRPAKEKAFSDWAWTVAGILYVGLLISYLVALRGLDDGRNWLFYIFFVTFASDTAAFFIGSTFGKTKLSPEISPAKTVEGAVAGLFGAVALSLCFTIRSPFYLPLGWSNAVVLGLLVSVFGQLGDLAESLFKRNVGVKDSGVIFPGHGGFLDRMDSIVFAGVVVYYYVVWVIQ